MWVAPLAALQADVRQGKSHTPSTGGTIVWTVAHCGGRSGSSGNGLENWVGRNALPRRKMCKAVKCMKGLCKVRLNICSKAEKSLQET